MVVGFNFHIFLLKSHILLYGNIKGMWYLSQILSREEKQKLFQMAYKATRKQKRKKTKRRKQKLKFLGL
jgi:hypothetical protein